MEMTPKIRGRFLCMHRDGDRKNSADADRRPGAGEQARSHLAHSILFFWEVIILNNYSDSLINFIESSPSSFHVVSNCENMLRENGFEKLDFSSDWDLRCGGRYYTAPYRTTLFAFTVPNDMNDNMAKIRFAGAHTDFPCFKIKPAASLKEHDYLKLNVESYGGVILNTWLDRPLSIAGMVAVKSDDPFKPQLKLVDFKRPIAVIPNLAIHMNREINKGIELNKQTELSPVIAMLEKSLNNSADNIKDVLFLNTLAKEIGVDPEDILDFDLNLYVCEKGTLVGLNNEFISCPRLDNLTSVLALTLGIMEDKSFDKENHDTENGNAEKHDVKNDDVVSRSSKTLNIIALYDNEEVGSRSKQGADSMLSNILITKIYSRFGYSTSSIYDRMTDGLMFSVDVSHALHPNYLSKNDPALFAELTKGVVLKFDSTQKYASDAEALAIAAALCKSNGIPYQKFANRSDMTSGSTLGSIASKWLPMKTVDLGVPLLAMHSAREMMGSKDQESLTRLMKLFFS